MQDRRPQGLAGNLLVPCLQQPPLPLPYRHQTTGGDLRVQVIGEDLADLLDRHAQRVMHPTAQGHHAMAQGGLGQGIGHGRLDVLPAGRAIVPVNGVFGENGAEVFKDVLDGSGSGAGAAL